MKKLILFVLLAFAPLSAAAQSNDSQGETCGMESNSQEARDFLNSILGTWTLSHQSGYVVTHGRTIPFPAAGDAEQQEFVRDGEKLFMVDPKSDNIMQFYWAMEGDWNWGGEDMAAGVPAPTLSSDDLETVLDCSLSELPRLIGKGSIMVQGIQMDYVVRLAVVGSGIMYGVMHISGNMGADTFWARRTVVFIE